MLRGVRAGLPAILAALLAGGVVAGGWFGYHWLTGSDRFAVAEIELNGNQQLAERDVRDILGIREGDNIFELGLPALERRLEAAPWIADAKLERRLPDTLIIELEEERPAALVELDGLYLADAEGRAFKRADISAGEGLGLPIVTGIPRERYARSPELAQSEIREALAALAIYGADPGRPEVAEIHLDPRLGIVFHTRETAMAIRVGDGDAATLARRLRTFDAAWTALSDAERITARVVYLDNETRPDRVTVGFDRNHETEPTDG